MPKIVRDAEIEKAKAFHDLGWKNITIAKEMGVSQTTIGRWLRRPDPDEIRAELNEKRLKERTKYIEDAWKIVLQINDIITNKLKKPEMAFKNAKEAATVMGIYMDKIGVLEARNKKTIEKRPSININILPPDGYTTEIESNPIQVHAESGEISGDGSGSGERKDILALPAGDNGESGESGDLRDDSSKHLQESQ